MQVPSTSIGSAGAVAVALGLCLAVAPGCDTSLGEDPNCERCDPGVGFEGALDGLADPIATWLRSLDLDASGILRGDYHTVLEGIRETQGCSPEQTRTFVISDDLVSSTPFPRLVATVCNGTNKATDFFLALSFEEQDAGGSPTGNIDIRDIEMFAWDNTAQTYRFYAAVPVEDSSDEVQVEVNPARCLECHLTPSDIDPLDMGMLPIMNELTQPWTNWNAEPGFPSHDFELPPRALEGNYHELATGCIHDDGRPGPCAAADLEQLIRRAHDRVALARVRGIFDADPDVERVMSLLRPMFCTEQVNYVTEDFDSGILSYATIVDPGLRNMLRQVRPDNWPQAWVNDNTMRLPTPEAGDVPLVQIPVRGNADIRYENQLVTLQGLRPHQVMRVRALDYTRPVFSEFRCQLWVDALRRMRQSPPDLSSYAMTRDALGPVLEEVLRLDRQSIQAGDDTTVIALDRATPARLSALEAALASGDITTASCETDGFCPTDHDGLAQLVQAHADSILRGDDPRDTVRQERDRRICYVRAEVSTEPTRFGSQTKLRYENLPSLPEVQCD
jgi:hypothetical protein